MTRGAMSHPVRGVVEHVEAGTESGTDSWFHNPQAQASAHFGIAKDGTVDQWVDTDDKAWAEATYNPVFWSIETEGDANTPLTAAQIESFAHVFVWLANLDGIPFAVTDSPSGRGLITHGDLGGPGGSHFGCPGDQRKAQRGQIIDRARSLVGQTPPVATNPSPAPTPPSGDIYTVEAEVAALPVIKQGSTGQFVRICQGLLIANGRNVGVDGDFGPASAAALREWQGAAGLTADGVCGPQTWRRLLCI